MITSQTESRPTSAYLVSEQRNYGTRIAPLQHLNPSPYRINIRKFCPTIIRCYYWNAIPISIRRNPRKRLFKRALFQSV